MAGDRGMDQDSVCGDKTFRRKSLQALVMIREEERGGGAKNGPEGLAGWEQESGRHSGMEGRGASQEFIESRDWRCPGMSMTKTSPGKRRASTEEQCMGL